MNIGAGRVVYQDLLRIDRAIANGSFATESVLQEALSQAKHPGVRLHLMGLVSRGGVHSQQAHLHALVDAAENAGVPDCVIHAFTDGRDTAHQMVKTYLGDLERPLEGQQAQFGSVHGLFRHGSRQALRTWRPHLRGPPRTVQCVLR